MEVRHNTARVGGHTVRALQVGEGRPLVFLHGFGIDPQVYAPIWAKLADAHAVTALDLFRPSSVRDTPRRLETYARWVVDWAEDAFGGQPWDMVGHSMGGAVSLYAASLSDRIDRVVVVNPALPSSKPATHLLRSALGKGLRQNIGRYGFGVARFATRFHAKLFADVTRHPRSTARMVRAISRLSYAPLHIPQPVLLVMAERDEFFDLTAFDRGELARSMHQLTVAHADGWRHDDLIFEPDRAAAWMRGFLGA